VWGGPAEGMGFAEGCSEIKMGPGLEMRMGPGHRRRRPWHGCGDKDEGSR
jgi:hypothetical protein